MREPRGPMDVTARGARPLRPPAWLPAVVLLAAAGAHPAAAQQSLLDRWTVGHLTEGWKPRWGPGGAWTTLPGGESPARLRVSTELEAVSLRSGFQQSASGVSLSTSRPVAGGSSVMAVVAGGGASTRTGGRDVLVTPFAPAAALGADVPLARVGGGTVRLLGLVGWEEGPGGLVGAVAGGPRQALAVTAWRAPSQPARVLLPEDSLGAVAGRSVASGARVAMALDVGVGPVRLRPEATWEREWLSAASSDATAFLSASPTGWSGSRALGLAADLGDWGASARWGWRGVDVESGLTRLDASAGRLAFARLDLTSWDAGVSRVLGARRWSLGLGRDGLRGGLSARVDTWPFVDLWATLSAHAYRLRGDVSGSSLRARLGSEARGAGLSWAVSLGRYEAIVDRESWYVTDLGFGRSDEQEGRGGVDPAILLGVELRRDFPLADGQLGIAVEGGLPVHARTLGPASPGDSRGGLAGYVRSRVTWAW